MNCGKQIVMFLSQIQIQVLLFFKTFQSTLNQKVFKNIGQVCHERTISKKGFHQVS